MQLSDQDVSTRSNPDTPVRCLVVDDSPSDRRELVRILEREDDLEVIGEAGDGDEAILLTKSFGPDVVSMDVQMPNLDGFSASRAIMRDAPTPIVLVADTRDTEETRYAMQALEAGALTVVQKPSTATDPARAARIYTNTIRAMSEIEVSPRSDGEAGRASRPRREAGDMRLRADVVAVAASTGGPKALHDLLTPLPADFPVPILVVQHIAAGFTDGLAHWLDSDSSLDVVVAADGDRLTRGAAPGTVYIAPSDRHLGLADARTVAVVDAPPIGGHRPSATYLFRTVGAHAGRNALGLILTGMGSDGVDGLAEMRAAGAEIIAQDATSSVVFGMPAAAVDAGVVDALLPIDAIRDRLLRLAPVARSG